MITLGINPFSHDSSAAIVKDGVLIAASAEERFNREKHSAKIPKAAIKFCIKEAKLDSINEIKEISFGFNFLRWRVLWFLDEIGFFFFLPNQAREIIYKGDNHFYNAIKNIFNILDTRAFIRNELGYTGKIAFHDHHDSHAASSYFSSGFTESAIITADGRGERASTRIYAASGTHIERLLQINYPHSLGLLYTSITHYLGFLRNCDEGKVMGLSSYGDTSLVEKMNRVISIKDTGEYTLNLSYFTFWWNPYESVSKKFLQLFGPARQKSEPITSRHQNIAKATQVIVEKAMLKLAIHAKKVTQSPNLCLAGGVTLNSVTNGKIIAENIFDSVFIYPAAGDDGIAVGAALLSYYKYNATQIISEKNKSPYVGYEASTTEVLEALKQSKLHFSQEANIFKTTAQLMSEGKFIGWYQGAQEFGPRALGNRSIIADPRFADNKDKLNAKVKFRESFRPFAPSVIKEKAPLYFENCTSDNPYMIVTFDVIKEMKNKIPAVTHVDGTARVQTVTKEQNEKYYKLIQAFEEITGIPVVLNTSFNVMNEPIVTTPQEAIKCFLNSGLDILVMDTYLIIK